MNEQLDLVEYAAHTRARNLDPETSVEAAEAIIERISGVQADVLEAFLRAGPDGLTDRELTMKFSPHGASTYRTRRSELTTMGLIADSGRRKTYPGERQLRHIVWTLAQHLESQRSAA